MTFAVCASGWPPDSPPTQILKVMTRMVSAAAVWETRSESNMAVRSEVLLRNFGMRLGIPRRMAKPGAGAKVNFGLRKMLPHLRKALARRSFWTAAALCRFLFRRLFVREKNIRQFGRG